MPDIFLRLDIFESPPGVVRVHCNSSWGEEAVVHLQLPVRGEDLRRRLFMVEKSVLKSASPIVNRGAAAVEEPVRQLGADLGDALLQDKVRELFETLMRKGSADEPARLLLSLDGPTVSQLPWEFLYDKRLRDYVALNVPIARYPPVMKPITSLTVEPPLRILCVAARPYDRAQLDVTGEQHGLASTLGKLGSGRVRLRWLEGESWHALKDAVRDEPWHVLHFVGHGGFDDETREGYLDLVRRDGTADQVSATDFGNLLQDNPSLRVVVLNACESGRIASGEPSSSIAATLMERGIPSVVAMQYEISDPAALTFAAAFYQALADNLPLDRAVTDAREAVKREHRSLEWGTPVLYLRSPHTRIFESAPDDTDAPGARPETSTSQAVPPSSGARDSGSRGPGVPRQPAHPAEARPPTRGPALLAQVSRLQHWAAVRSIAFGPDRGFLAVGCEDGTVPVWDTDTARVVLVFRNNVQSPRANRVTSTVGGRSLWDAATAGVAQAFGSNVQLPQVNRVTWTADGRRLGVAYRDGSVRVWNPPTETAVIAVRPAGLGTAWSVVFSPDGRRLAVAGSDQSARILDTGGHEVVRLVHRVETHNAAGWPLVPKDVADIAFSPGGSFLATAANDGLVRIWNTQGVIVSRLQHPDAVHSVAFSGDGRRIVSGCADGVARVWDNSASAIVASVRHLGPVRTAAFSPDGRWLVSGGDDRSVVVSDSSGVEAARAAHDWSVTAVGWHPAGHLIASASSDRTVRLWRTPVSRR